MGGIGPDQLKIKELLDRVNQGGIKEVIMATNYCGGRGHRNVPFQAAKAFGDKGHQLAYGIPVGGDLEYADEVT